MDASTLTLVPLLEKIEHTRGALRRDRIEAAYRLVEQLYGDQKHWTGVPLIAHVLEVLDMLLPFEPDEDTVIACLLHHVLKTRQVTLQDLETQFGPKVRSLVSGVHLLSHVTLQNRRNSIEDLRLMLLSVSDDVRVVLIILCDRCAVLEHAADIPPDVRRRAARDVLNLFAPVSARLGIHALKQRLEQLAFPIVYAPDAERIHEQLQSVHARYGDFLPVAAAELHRALAEDDIAVDVKGREKNPYSIFMKMKMKSMTHVERMHDLFALRVIVPTVAECYQALGVLHRLGRPVTNRFKDFIAFPKPNGYQSLHTTLVRLPGVPESLFVEVQIRTESMHREAEFGIAAHWSYKEGGSAEQVAHRVQLKNVLAGQYAVGEEAASALADHIFVLTPKGDIVELPEGATPLDFAFQIHTDLGLSFRSARVNGNIVPLDYDLENGDVIEITKHHTPQASPEWLQLVKLASSRVRLKRYLALQNRDAFVARSRATPHATPSGTTVALPVQHARARLQHKEAIVEIEGGVRMPMRFAKCCKPKAAESKPIVGFVTRSGEVTIHLLGCRLHRSSNPERQVEVWWRKE